MKACVKCAGLKRDLGQEIVTIEVLRNRFLVLCLVNVRVFFISLSTLQACLQGVLF